MTPALLSGTGIVEFKECKSELLLKFTTIKYLYIIIAMISSVRYTIRYIRMAFHGYSITFLQPAVSLVVSGTCSRIALHTAVGVQAFVL